MAFARLVHRTKNGVEICVLPGTKSQYDFKVVYTEPRKRRRTPRHIHMIVELYVKEAHDKATTYALRDHLLAVYNRLTPATVFPPSLQVYNKGDSDPFRSLDAVGEFSVEFFLVTSELIFIQEKTNYPDGSLTQKLYQTFGIKDRFAVVGMATQTQYG